jgi:hypothetical protein
VASKSPEPLEVEDRDRVDYWRKRAGELERALAVAQESKTAQEVLCEQVHELAPKSYQPAPFNPKAMVKKVSGGTAQSAVLLFSDTHIGAVVKEEQTLNMGCYNFELFLRQARAPGAIRFLYPSGPHHNAHYGNRRSDSRRHA